MLHPRRVHFTLEDYFDLEQHSSVKHEYCAGEIFAMAGASLAHNHICGNLFAILRSGLRGRGGNAFGSDLRIATPGGLYTYPDISVICGDVRLTADRLESAQNPVLLVEIASEATRDYDRGEKFVMYRTIPELQEYVLVEQSQVAVECWRKTPDGTWASDSITDLDASLELRSIGLAVPCREIYREVFA